MIVIIPSLLCIIINGLIFIHVHASSHRVQPQNTTTQTINNNTIHQQSKINRRNIHLLRHMLFMFCMFIGGWGPIHIAAIIMNYININVLIMRILSIIAEISMLCNVVDLFVYNRKLRHYLKNIMLKCFEM